MVLIKPLVIYSAINGKLLLVPVATCLYHPSTSVREFCLLPCSDLPTHPNLDLVAPHRPVTLASHLDDLCDRLALKSEDQAQESLEESDDTYTSNEENTQAIHNLRTSILKLVKSY